MKSFNLAIGGGLVIDPRFNYNRNPSLVFAPTGGTVKHPVIDPLGPNRAVLLPGAAPIHVFGQSTRGQPPTEPVNPKLIPAPILQTTNYSWAESNPKNPPLRLDPEPVTSPARSLSGWRSPSVRRRPASGNVTAGKPRLVLVLEPRHGRKRLSGDRADQPRPAHERRELAAEPARHAGNTPAYPCRPHAGGRSVLAIAADPGPIGRGRDADHRDGNHGLHGPTTITNDEKQPLDLDLGWTFLRDSHCLLGLERAGVLTENERRLRETRILPALIDVPEASVQQARDRPGKRAPGLRAARAGSGSLEMVEPIDVAAEPTQLETLVRNLKELRKSLDSGSVAGPPDSFGLAPPVATVKLWGAAAGGRVNLPRSRSRRLALGKTVRNVQYVRAAGTDAIEVADAKLLNAVELPVNDWREQVVMGVPTFSGRVGDDQATRAGHPRRTRQEGAMAAVGTGKRPGQSRQGRELDRRPFVPAGRRRRQGVRRRQRQGLRSVRSRLTGDDRDDDNRPGDVPLVLHVGKPVPDQPERIYVRQGDQDDVVIVDAKALAEVPTSAVALRSQQVADIEPAAVTEIQIRPRSARLRSANGPINGS